MGWNLDAQATQEHCLLGGFSVRKWSLAQLFGLLSAIRRGNTVVFAEHEDCIRIARFIA